MNSLNKRKIINDPVYGFISTPSDLVYDLINHRYFQRLRRIKQLGLTHLVYPGAVHSRFQHALGAMHLMGKAIEVLKSKGQAISPEEAEGAILAILLHDIGHGPFSHALERTIVKGVNHEYLSLLFMDTLNKEFSGRLGLAIEIYRGTYPKAFLNQLVSGQLDVDRLDYLKRDSFYTGVSEGVVGSDRIIKMLNVVDGELVVEAKGIYSIEKFLFARRFMYWQVYLHKTVVSAEHLLVLTLKRAKQLCRQGFDIPAPVPLKYFLMEQRDFNALGLESDNDKALVPLDLFASLDDTDIMSALKSWIYVDDTVLSSLSSRIVNRNLYRIEMSKIPFTEEYIRSIQEKIQLLFQVNDDDLRFFVHSDIIRNTAYSLDQSQLTILFNDGRTADISESSDLINVQADAGNSVRYFLMYPKE